MQAVKPIYVLYACALLRFAQGGPGANQVEEVLNTVQAGECRVLMHQINLGELVYRIEKGFGWAVAKRKRRLKSICSD
jgi:hypothetical protein